jgi:hypothetical protein
MTSGKWQMVFIAMCFSTVVAFAGCSKKQETPQDKVNTPKQDAPVAKETPKEAEAPKAPAVEYTYKTLCDRYVKEYKAFFVSPVPDTEVKKLTDSCMAVSTYYPDAKNAKELEKAYAEQILTACEGKTAGPWDDCYYAESEKAYEKFKANVQN